MLSSPRPIKNILGAAPTKATFIMAAHGVLVLVDPAQLGDERRHRYGARLRGHA